MPQTRSNLLILATVTAIAVVCAVSWLHLSSPEQAPTDAANAGRQAVTAVVPEPYFVGRTTCAGCHSEQDRLWKGSHHDLAMQEASMQTVLGNFNDAAFWRNNVVSRFFRRDGKFIVNTDGPDGKLADFEIKYTFGISPLQQYLVALPGGRLQALSIAWDSRPKEQGGQRWFHLYPKEKIDHNDPLHWTRSAQNWNYMCAECHSTNLQKNYDPVTRTYSSAWSEIDVACEACHGPGSLHVGWAKGETGLERFDAHAKGLPVVLDERRNVQWTFAPPSRTAQRNRPRGSEKEIQICARCHARRAQQFGDYRYGQHLLDTHLPSLLEESLYHADGQIDGEVYEYGAFVQSRMYQAGVTCSDCHDPHSLKLRIEGNGVCVRCHAADRFETPQHHFHHTGGGGTNCVDCHMPAKTYMVIDQRRDHSFRVPRPDLSIRLGTPNACTGCHRNKPNRWAADKLRSWYGQERKGYQAYAETLHAARSGALDAEIRLVALLQAHGQPAIARATAASELSRWLSPASLPILAQALADADPLVRVGALEPLQTLPAEQRWTLIHDRLSDPARTVRAVAAGALADIPPTQIPEDERADLQRATAEYLAAQAFNADESGAQVNLGNFRQARGEYAEAERAYREALNLDPDWVPAYVNLGDLYRQTARDSEGEMLLRDALTRHPEAAVLHHSLGLLKLRQHSLKDALASLSRATELAPDDARFRYVHAVALQSAGRTSEARAVVEAGLKRAPGDRVLNALRAQLGLRPLMFNPKAMPATSRKNAGSQ